MKLLLDTCVSPRTRDAFVRDGHDVVWAGDWQFDRGDRAELLAGAIATVTKDRTGLRPAEQGGEPPHA